jgi:hypothetical protein
MRITLSAVFQNFPQCQFVRRGAVPLHYQNGTGFGALNPLPTDGQLAQGPGRHHPPVTAGIVQIKFVCRMD